MKLNKEQYIAAHHKDGPMLVLAGPGSGKTHLLVERIRIMIEEEQIAPENILVITFSKKAARQMEVRFLKRVAPNKYPVTFGTFHAVFYDILRNYDPDMNDLITDKQQETFVKKAIDNCGLYGGSLCTSFDPPEMVGLIGAYKNFGKERFIKTGPGKDMDENEISEFLRLYDEYVKLCRSEGLIDFDDMIILCREILYKHEGLLRKWQDKYRYILVDEFQDINDGQYDVLRLLAGDKRNVFAVGDDDQSIYAFRGARPELMQKFLRRFIGCRQVTLTMNYRCSKNIISAADTVIRHNFERMERPMQRHMPSKDGGMVTVVNSESTDVQAAYVCDMIKVLTKEAGYSAKDIAVLYRSAHCAKRFIQVAEDLGIGLRITGDGAITPKRVKIHEAYIRAHEHKASRADMFLIMNNPPRSLSRESLCDCTGDDYIECMLRYYRDDSTKLAAVYDLNEMIDSYDVNKNITEDENSENGYGDRVNVMTAHASKGLEFKCVFIIGLQEGLFPHVRDMSGNAEEERRLMYVAMTRAIERLYMCTVSTKHGKRPSRFVKEAQSKTDHISDMIRLRRV